MWSRKDLKTKAKEKLKLNYWKMVLVALILSLVAGTASIPGKVGNGISNKAESSVESMQENMNANEISDENDGEIFVKDFTSEIGTTGMVVLATLMIPVFLLILAIGILFQAFILNPIIIGCKSFFYINLNHKANVSEVSCGFDKSYRNGVKIMFFKDLYTFLWSLLLIVPGIVKAYEYRMIPYLLADNSEMEMATAFATSKQMMNGNKWKTFVLDLSFIGWRLLALMTCGILNIFYVEPYKQQTDAALYESLKDTESYEEN